LPDHWPIAFSAMAGDDKLLLAIRWNKSNHPIIKQLPPTIATAPPGRIRLSTLFYHSFCSISSDQFNG
jgi:hypothetical protein